jgi:plasmid maintenance system antidote protein VapI
VLNPTQPEVLIDNQGRPYFLWDCDMKLEDFQRGLEDPDPEVQAYFVGKVMRQAKPDDVFTFVSAAKIKKLWPRLERYLGRSREFWTWLFAIWEAQDHALDIPQQIDLDGVPIQVDIAHEILVNKLSALLSRSELRDLLDAKALLENGGNLERALEDAPRKDAGFSALTLAWALKSFPLQAVAQSLGVSDREIDELAKFQTSLIDKLIASHP